MEPEAKKVQTNQQNNEEGQKMDEGNEANSNNYFKNFKQNLNDKFGQLSREKLLQLLIDSQIQNKKLSNRLAELEPFKQRNLRRPNGVKTARLFEEFQSQKFALKICYLGHLYDGMALQMQTENTIEEHLFKCMHTLNLIETNRPAADYTRAGRTDKGVSAMGNVVALKLRTKNRKKGFIGSVQTGKNQGDDGNVNSIKQQRNGKQEKELNYCEMLNSILPDDIRIIACEAVEEEFNARYWCKQRSYKYFFVKNNLNIEEMSKAITHFEGKHNFINFCKMNLCNTVNFQRSIIKAEIVKVCNEHEAKKEGMVNLDDRNEVYYFHFVGNSFLWHQIRFMSSVLFMIGQGSQKIDIIQDLLNIQKYPRKPNYTMAPEYPLILQDCLYENLEFKPHPQTIYRFYNTLHNMISKNTIEQTLIVNCMHMAKRDLLANIHLSEQAFIQGVLQNFKRTHKVNKKSMELHKASGRGMDEAIKSLKGKKKDLYEKKAQKQADFEAKEKMKLNNQSVVVASVNDQSVVVASVNDQPAENAQTSL